MSKILVVGDAMLDIYHFGDVKRISPEAPVPVFLETGRKRYTPGGAANVAINVAAIGIETSFLAIVGNDEYGHILQSKLAESGVDTRFILKKESYNTISKLRYIGPGNQQILRVDTEDTSPIDFDVIKPMIERLEGEISDFSLVIISDYLKGLLTESVTKKIIKISNNHNIPVVIDVKDTKISKYSNAMLIKPNRKELSMLTGEQTDSVEQAIFAATKLCREADCKYVMATLGAEGMILCDKTGLIKEIKSVANEVYDVTGAGDTSIAYLAAEMVNGTDIETAMLVSNYAAGIQVSKVGTAIVYPDEVYSAMQEHGVNVSETILDYYKTNGLAPLERLRNNGKRIVFTNGCFDILHSGHIKYLREAKALGDILVIGLNSDASVKRLKGMERPINTLEDRAALLAAIGFVDYVIPFEEDTPLELIKAVKPSILVKGGDYKVEDIVGAREVMADGGDVRVIDYVPGKSTTMIIDKMRGV